MAWVKKGAPFDTYRQIVNKGGGGCAQQSYGLSTGADGGLWWNVALRGPGGEQLNATTATGAVAPAAIWDDQWHAIAGTFDGSTATLYVDGAQVASAPVAVDGSTIDYELIERRLAVGRYTQDPFLCDPAGFQFRGAIDEVRVYTRALSAAEIAFLHRSDHMTPPFLPEPTPGEDAPPAAPENVVLPEIRSAPDGSYTCDPGTWRNVSEPPNFTYRWLVVQGASTRVAAETQSYTPSARDYGYPVLCQVTAAGATGPVTASSPRVFFSSAGLNTLPPAYGDVRIRGIDVFQTVQPNSAAPQYRYNPDGSGGPFVDLCGAGTPTSWRVGPVPVPGIFGDYIVHQCTTGDGQYADYDGVVLDRYKPTTAVVYVDVSGSVAADKELDYDLELSATRAGRVSLGEPVVVRVENPPRTYTQWVLPWERDGTNAGDGNDHGIRIPLPSAWSSRGASIRLHARLRFPDRDRFGMGSYGTRQCDYTGCEANDSFTLNDVPFADYPELLIATLQLRRSTASPPQGGLRAPDSVLDRARQLFPGGSRIVVSPYSTGLNITNETDLNATDPDGDGTFTCNASSGTDADVVTRDCRERAVAAIMLQWITDNAARSIRISLPFLGDIRIPARVYDVVMGVHDYDIPLGAGTGAEPGAARGDLTDLSRTRPVQADDTPFFHATSRTRRLTAAAHELGHILTAKHNGTCRGATGLEPWPELDPAANQQGRLQGVKFERQGEDAGRVIGVATVDGPYTLADGTAAPTKLFDLMSYCADLADTFGSDGNAWLSPRNWNRFNSELWAFRSRLSSTAAARSAATNSSAARAGAAQARRGRAFAVGVAGPTGGQILRVVPPDGQDAVAGSLASSPFRLRSLASGGRVLLDAGIEVRPSSESDPDEGGAFTGPVARGAVAVELLRDGTVLDRLERSRRPSVRLLAPRRSTRVSSRGRLNVRWRASDRDSDELFATVDFSPDNGRSWRTVYAGPSRGRARIPGSYLSASRRARVRISINDGFSERSVTSAAFSAAGMRPRVEILTPQRGSLLRSGERSRLMGTAFDDQGRPLRGRALTWYAGRKRLGRGARLNAKLPPSARRLRLVARDGTGRTGVARLPVRVSAPRLRIVNLDVPMRVRRRARSVTIRIRASAPATLVAGGRRFRVRTTRTRLTIPLPRRPAVGVVEVRFRLSARSRGVKGTVRGTFAVART